MSFNDFRSGASISVYALFAGNLPSVLALAIRRLHDTDRSGAWACSFLFRLLAGSCFWFFSAQKYFWQQSLRKRSEVWFKLILDWGDISPLFINNNKYYFPLKVWEFPADTRISLPPYCHDASHNNIDLAGRFRADDTQPPFPISFSTIGYGIVATPSPASNPDVYLQSCSPLSAAVCPAAVGQHRALTSGIRHRNSTIFHSVTSDNGSGS